MKIKIIIGLLCIGILTGCGNDDDSKSDTPLTPAQKIAKKKSSGEQLQLDLTDTVAGIDADQNGIRDDIDAYIQKTYPTEEQRKAVSQYARSLQASLLVDLENKIQLRQQQIPLQEQLVAFLRKCLVEIHLMVKVLLKKFLVLQLILNNAYCNILP
ncbi:hypothetical protein [Acinetobacter haemolyticus]|uniref:hypothetical protein n=1 Tax=Acinetobacter haemolyticus TaxID=29430 RepID=UPI001D0EFD87|nr:hypothetical protein [Acinetobacter haemolyticus]